MRSRALFNSLGWMYEMKFFISESINCIIGSLGEDLLRLAHFKRDLQRGPLAPILFQRRSPSPVSATILCMLYLWSFNSLETLVFFFFFCLLHALRRLKLDTLLHFWSTICGAKQMQLGCAGLQLLKLWTSTGKWRFLIKRWIFILWLESKCFSFFVTSKSRTEGIRQSKLVSNHVSLESVEISTDVHGPYSAPTADNTCQAMQLFCRIEPNVHVITQPFMCVLLSLVHL